MNTRRGFFAITAGFIGAIIWSHKDNLRPLHKIEKKRQIACRMKDLKIGDRFILDNQQSKVYEATSNPCEHNGVWEIQSKLIT